MIFSNQTLDTFQALDLSRSVYFWVCCSRICSWSLFLKLKFCSHCLQTTLKQAFFCLICFKSRLNEKNWAKHLTHERYWDEKYEIEINDFAINSSEIVENAHVKSRSKFYMMMKIWFLNHANANFRKHLSNKSNTFDFKYWCWICWRCCKNLNTLLYKTNFKISMMRIESKISISTKIDDDFETFCLIIYLTFCLIDSIRFLTRTFTRISNSICFWTFFFFRFWTFSIRSALRLTRSIFCSSFSINS